MLFVTHHLAERPQTRVPQRLQRLQSAQSVVDHLQILQRPANRRFRQRPDPHALPVGAGVLRHPGARWRRCSISNVSVVATLRMFAHTRVRGGCAADVAGSPGMEGEIGINGMLKFMKNTFVILFPPLCWKLAGSLQIVIGTRETIFEASRKTSLFSKIS